MYSMVSVHESSARPPADLQAEFRALLFRARELAYTHRGWWGPIAVTVVAALIRFIHLGHPSGIVFDETYYVKDAYGLSQMGYDVDWPDDVNAEFATNPDTYLDKAAYTVHPPVGKWLIAWGIQVGGVHNPWAWRLTTALLGTLAVLILARAAGRLFSSTVLGVAAGGLLAIDGLAIVMSRIALLDGILAFFAVVAFACLIADRFRTREKLALSAAAIAEAGGNPATARAGIRWWRVAAIVALGLAMGTKWSGLYFLAAFGVMTLWWDASARRALARWQPEQDEDTPPAASGARRWLYPWALRDAATAVGLGFLAIGVYVATWWSWFTHLDAWGRTWHLSNPAPYPAWLPDFASGWWDAARSFIHYHATMLDFHSHLDAHHQYMSNPWLWLFQYRPTSFYWQRPEDGCVGQSDCVQAILALGHPLLWWLGVVALGVAVWNLVRRRDWRAGAIVAGYCGAWVPWLFFAHRTIFTFYMVVLSPFVALAVVYLVRVALDRCEISDSVTERANAEGPLTRAKIAARREVRRARRRKHTINVTAIVGAAVMAIVALFFLPIWTGMGTSYLFWLAHIWLPSWV